MRCAQPLVIIIMSFAIGANSSINTVFTAGLSGILLGIISALTGIVFYFIYNLFLKKSALGAALGTTAASSALTPAMVAVRILRWRCTWMPPPRSWRRRALSP
nr:2-keto-3-deoxygluconate permease [Klebsiella pneumoniae]